MSRPQGVSLGDPGRTYYIRTPPPTGGPEQPVSDLRPGSVSLSVPEAPRGRSRHLGDGGFRETLTALDVNPHEVPQEYTRGGVRSP